MQIQPESHSIRFDIAANTDRLYNHRLVKFFHSEPQAETRCKRPSPALHVAAQPKESRVDPEVAKGQKIAVGSCISCHKCGNAGGHRAGSSSEVLTERVVNSKDYFRKYVTDPHSMNPTSHMPPHPTFDDGTFNALEAYFKAMWAEEFSSGQRPGNSH